MSIEIKSRFTGDTIHIYAGADLQCANLRGADLQYANLQYANLYGANLQYANLRSADLYGADLQCADLQCADLRGADLRGADLRGADLQCADLRGADLRGADLQGARLQGANLQGARLQGANLQGALNLSSLIVAQLLIVPEGDIIGYKKLQNGVICKLRIPADAKRSNATGRKCRAEFAVVLDGAGHSQHDSNFCYKVGETVRPVEPFCNDRFNECASGIHFYLTRIEAENH